jgi:hypothetical protein
MSLKYGAISIDTSIFDRYGLRLTSHPLKSLEQFCNKPAGLVISEIVIREVHSHLKRKIEETRQQLSKALKEASRLELDQTKIDALNDELRDADANELAKSQIGEFATATGLDLIIAEKYVKTSDLIKRYFKSEPPFAESGQKKSEFPDAICLMPLEAYAKENNLKIIAVSADSDWASFAEKSEWIDVESDLSKALAQFHPQKSAYDFCLNLLEHLDGSNFDAFRDELTVYIEDKVASMDVDVNAESALHWELSEIEVNLDSYQLVGTGSDSDIRPIQIHSSGMTFAAKIIVNCRASAEFSLSAYDSVDKDHVYLGGCSDSTEFDFEAEIFVTVSGDLDESPAEIEIENVDINFPQVRVDFGYIEPDWHDEDYE